MSLTATDNKTEFWTQSHDDTHMTGHGMIMTPMNNPVTKQKRSRLNMSYTGVYIHWGL